MNTLTIIGKLDLHSAPSGLKILDVSDSIKERFIRVPISDFGCIKNGGGASAICRCLEGLTCALLPVSRYNHASRHWSPFFSMEASEREGRRERR
jgi:hypothetical protein